MLKRLLQQPTHTITSAAFIVASFSIVSRFVGFIRDRILAGTFGASDVLDVYFAAFRIPDLFFQLIVVGALSASFIPLFTRYYGKGKEEKAWELTNKMVNLLAIVFGVAIFFAILFAPYLASFVGLGFSPEKQMAVASMSRVMFFGQFLLALSMVYGSVLQGAKRFVLYSMAPIFYNIGIITGAIFFVPLLGTIGLAWGVTFGAFLHFFLQFMAVLGLGYRYRPVLRIRDKDVIYTMKHMLPRVLGLAVNQFNFVGMTVLASLLVGGSVAILQFAYNLNFFPIGVIAVSYAVAAFPTLCELAEKEDKKSFILSFSEATRQILFFMVPATILFIALRAQVVRVVLGAGAFDWPATIVTADTLGFFALSFIAQSLIFLLVRAYFAFEDTVTPFIIGLVSAALNITLAWFLIDSLGVVGFGVAYSLSSTLQMLLLWLGLRHKTGSLGERKMIRSFGIFSIAGFACALVAQSAKSIVVEFITLETFWGVFLQGFIAGIAALAAYAAVTYALGSEEVRSVFKGLRRRFVKRARVEEEIVTEMNS